MAERLVNTEDDARTKAQIGALALVVIIFAGVGPFIGGLVLLQDATISNPAASFGGGISGYFDKVLFTLILGYVFGVGYAFIAGVIVAVTGIWMKLNNFLVPLVAGVAVSALPVGWLYFGTTVNFGMIPWLLPICLIAAFICWFLTRGIVRRTWQSD